MEIIILTIIIVGFDIFKGSMDAESTDHYPCNVSTNVFQRESSRGGEVSFIVLKTFCYDSKYYEFQCMRYF